MKLNQPKALSSKHSLHEDENAVRKKVMKKHTQHANASPSRTSSSSSSNSSSSTDNSSSSSSSSSSDTKYQKNRSKKIIARKKYKRDSSSSSSSTDSSEEEKKRLNRKHEKKKSMKKIKLSSSSSSTKVNQKKKTNSLDKVKEDKQEETLDIPINLMEKSRLMAPMTREEWNAKQAVVRRVYDESTGRHRLIKGDGEVIEEIVSREHHKAINQQATKGDGDYFQNRLSKKS